MKLTNDEKYKLCLRFVHADSEEEIKKILNEYAFDETTDWKALGNSPTNWSIAGNQQNKPVPALIEKLTNSIDAVLLNACKERNIDPRSPKAPVSIKDAVSKFFDIRDGQLEKLDPNERNKIAANVMLVASGIEPPNPCLSIIDKGEGQTPASIESTLLSLPGTKEANKAGIKFVQGIFNMGGTGVLRFCGSHHYQLIVTKRNPKLLDDADREFEHSWSFTLIRRRFPKLGESSVFEYLAPGGQVMNFEKHDIPVCPGKHPIPHEGPLSWGTFIKLYEYDLIPKSLSTNILLDLFYELNKHFNDMYLPIRLYERRAKYSGHSFETTLSGMTVRLFDNQQVLEPGFPTGGILDVPEVGNIKMTINVFKKLDTKERKRWINSDPIILTLNGQTHGTISKSFLSRERINLDYIENDISIVLDCSEIEPLARENLFMASRDRLKEGREQENIKELLEDYLSNHEGLHQLAEDRRIESIKDAIGDNKSIRDVLDEIVEKSPIIADIFGKGSDLLTTNFALSTVKNEFKGKPFPTYFTIQQSSREKRCPLNSYCYIKFETDARNDYFIRKRTPGIMKTSHEQMVRGINLWNGKATLTIKPTESNVQGEKIRINIQVKDKTQTKPFTSSFNIIIDPPIDKRTNPKGINRNNHKEIKEDNTTSKVYGIKIPNPIKVKKNDPNWHTYQFTDNTGLKLLRQEGNFDAYVNMDNVHYKRYLQDIPAKNRTIVENQYLTGLILSSMSIYYSLYEREKIIQGNEYQNDEIFNIVNNVSNGLALSILPIINLLGKQI